MWHQLLEWSAFVVSVVGVLVMVAGFLIAVLGFVRASWAPAGAPIAAIQSIRCRLGVYLVFALELLIVADVLESIVSRTLTDLAFLGVLVLIRTIIGYFLNREIEEYAAPVK